MSRLEKSIAAIIVGLAFFAVAVAALGPVHGAPLAACYGTDIPAGVVRSLDASGNCVEASLSAPFPTVIYSTANAAPVATGPSQDGLGAGAVGLLTSSRTMLYNGATEDLARSNLDTGTIDLLAPATSTQTSVDQVNYNGRGLICFFNMTAITGTTPSAALVIQGKDVGTGIYYNLAGQTALTATGQSIVQYYPGLTTGGNLFNGVLPHVWRVAVVITGTTPSVTGTVGCSVNN